MFPALNFPPVTLSLREHNKRTEVFDIIRKKYLLLSPEEWVRQHVVHFLVQYKNYPGGLIELEKSISLFNTQKRVDILVRDKSLNPFLLVECKAPHVSLSKTEMEQLARYQITIRAPYIMLTNGLQHVFLALENNKPTLLTDLPQYSSITQ